MGKLYCNLGIYQPCLFFTNSQKYYYNYFVNFGICEKNSRKILANGGFVKISASENSIV